MCNCESIPRIHWRDALPLDSGKDGADGEESIELKYGLVVEGERLAGGLG